MNFTNQKSFYRPAEIVDTISLFPESANMTVDRNKEKSVIVHLEDGSKKIVNICSPSYALIHNKDIFPMIEKKIGESFEFDAKYKMCNDAVFYVDYELKNINYSVGDEKDKIIPMVRVFHSYNGYIRFHVEFGYKRLICSNGLYGYKFSDKFIMKHSHGNINAIINSCNVSVKRFVEQAEQFKSRYDILSQKEVTSPLERIEMVALSTNFPQKQVESVISKYEEESKIFPTTDWLIYNSFNYQLNHNENFTTDIITRTKLDKQIFNVIEKGIYSETAKKLVVL